MWSAGAIPYVIEGNFGQKDRAAIADSIAHLEKVSGLRFAKGRRGADRLMTFKASSNTDGSCWATFYYHNKQRVTATINLPPG